MLTVYNPKVTDKISPSAWFALIVLISAEAHMILTGDSHVVLAFFFLLFILALSHKYQISLSLVFFHLGTLLISLTTFRVGGPLFNASDLFYLISALLLIGITLGTKGDFHTVFIKNNPLLLPLLIFLFGAVLSMMNSADPRNAAIAIGKYVFLFGVWLPLGISLHDSVTKVRWMLIILVVASLLPITTCLSDYFLHTKITACLDQVLNLNLVTPYPTRDARFGAVMGHPNNFAVFLTVVFPIALWGALFSKGVLLRFCGVTYLMSVLTCVLISGSRGCFVAVTLQFALFYNLMSERGRLSSIIITFVIGAAIFVVFQASLAFFPQSPLARLDTMLSMKIGAYRADIGRVESLRQALSYIQEYPIAGIGVEHTAKMTQKLYVHNTLFRFWAGVGIFGLVSYLWFYGKPLWIGFRKIYNVVGTDFEKRSMIVIILCSIIGSILFDMTGPQFHNRVKWIFVIGLFALWNIETRKKEVPDSDQICQEETAFNPNLLPQKSKLPRQRIRD